MTERMKRCTGPCGETKPLEAFHRDRGRRDGRESRCAACKVAANAARYATKKAAGICCDCPAPAMPGRTRCSVHAADAAARRATKKAAGVCRDCGAAADDGSVFCAKHRAAYNSRDAARRTTRKAAGLCCACGAPADGGSIYCGKHRVEQNSRLAASKREAYAAAVAERRCAWDHGRGCNLPVEDGLTLCPTHRAEDAERRARRSARAMAAICAEWEDLDAFRCWLCDGAILPGEEMHRDHLVPVAHGGADRCEATGTTMLRPAHAYCNVSRQDDHVLHAVARLHPSFQEGAK